jgi:hypothetical protein
VLRQPGVARKRQGFAGQFSPSKHWALLRLGDTALMLNSAFEFDEERPFPLDNAGVAAHEDTGPALWVSGFGCSLRGIARPGRERSKSPWLLAIV